MHRGICRMLLVLCAALPGCTGKEQGLVLLTPSVTAPPILRSEADQIAVPVRVDAPLQFKNHAGTDASLGIAKTGCSCYGMATADSLWSPSELINVPAGGSLRLYFVTRELRGESGQAFRVAFHSGPTSSASVEAGAEFRADCSLRILPDLILEPASVVVDISPDVDARKTTEHPLTITRITRGRPADSPPMFSMNSALLSAAPPVLENSVEEIAPGLWRSIWKCSVRQGENPVAARNDGGRFDFTFEFPEGDQVPTGARPATSAGTIPTILDVVENRPPRSITGQLILRRSKGIIAPAQLHFGALPAKSGPRTRRLVLTAADRREFQVTVGELPPQFTAVADSAEPAVQQWVTVTLHPQTPGAIEEQLTLRTTHPDEPEVRVSLKARVE